MRLFRSLFLPAAVFAAPLAVSAQPAGGGAVMTLPTAIRAALDNNFGIRAQSFGTDAARADLRAEWGAFEPRFNGSYTYSEDGSPQSADPFSGNRPPSSVVEVDSYSLGIGGATPWGLSYRLSGYQQNQRGTFNAFADNYFSFAGLEFTQPLLNGFGFDANLVSVRLARAGHGISKWQYRQTVIDTVTNVIIAYHELDFAKKNLEIARRSRDLAQSLLDENEKRFAAGSQSEVDVTSARTRVAAREEAILFATQAVRVRENFLKRLISSDHSVNLLNTSLTTTTPVPMPPHTPSPALEFAAALERRPDYQQALLNVSRADVNRRYRRNQVLPTVNLVGSYGYNGLDTNVSESHRQVFDREISSYSLGAVVSMPFTLKTERARLASAKAMQQQAETLLASTEQDIVVSLGNAAGQIETAEKRVEATRHSLDLAAQILDAELKKLRAGTGSTFFVLAEQGNLASAEISAYRAQVDYQIALAAYDRELAVTLEKQGIEIDE